MKSRSIQQSAMKKRAQSSCLTANSCTKSRRRNINIKLDKADKDETVPETDEKLKSKPI